VKGHSAEARESLQMEHDAMGPRLLLHEAPALAEKIAHILRLILHNWQTCEGQIILYNVIQASDFHSNVRQGFHYLGTAVKRRRLEFPKYHIGMQEDSIQRIADLMDYLPSDIA
jgi:hypothetical protein